MPDIADPATEPKPKRLLRSAVVLDKVGGVAPETLWRWIRKGEFPEPRRLTNSSQTCVWPEEEVDAWIDARAKGMGRRPTNGLAERARRMANRKAGRTPKYGFVRRAP